MLSNVPKVKSVKLEDLTPYENNSRTHSDKQIAKLAESIKAFGFAGAIYTRDGIIAKGHGCYEAMKLLNDQGELIYPAPGKDGGAKPFTRGEAPVIDVSGWNDGQFKAFVIADNKLALESGWDDEILKFELESLHGLNFDVELTGFSFEDAKKISPKLVNFGLTKDDDIPPEPDLPTVQNGEVWRCGEHLVMCGDSTNPEDVQNLLQIERLNGGKADMLHADPPYGLGKEADGVMNDNLYNDKLDEFQMSWWNVWREYLAENGSAYIWGYPADLFRLWWQRLSTSEELMFKNDIVWNKRVIAGKKSELLTKYPIASEHCLFFVRGFQHFGNINTEDFFEGWEPVRAYLEGEAKEVELTPKKLEELTGVGMYSHWFSKSQWTLIPEKHYNTLREAFPENFQTPWARLKEDHDKAQQDYRNLVDSERAYFDNTHEAMWDVWDCLPVSGADRHGHATPKPVELVSRAILSSLHEKGTVLEPFLGSGSTLIAAERTGRICYGMEMQQAYCDVTIKRWQAYTGKTARRVEDGAYFDEVSSGNDG